MMQHYFLPDDYFHIYGEKLHFSGRLLNILQSITLLYLPRAYTVKKHVYGI